MEHTRLTLLVKGTGIRLLTLLALMTLSSMAHAQSTTKVDGLDLGAAIDAKTNEVNTGRQAFNEAMEPFYNAKLVDVAIGKPEIKVEGDRVKVLYPVTTSVNPEKFAKAYGKVMNVLNRVGTKLPDFGNKICDRRHPQCQLKHRKSRAGVPHKGYELNQHFSSGIKGVRVLLNTGLRPQTLQAWDMPKEAIDFKAVEKHLRTYGNAMRLKLTLTDANDQPVASTSARVGVQAARNREMRGAHYSGNLMALMSRPFYLQGWNLNWELDLTMTTKLKFELSKEEARMIKGARAEAIPANPYRGGTQKAY